MKKRILSALLCLVMVVGLLPTHVHASSDGEGDVCDFCGLYIWGDWQCNHGYHCGADSGNTDCYEENHCSECGTCIEDGDGYRCDDCGRGGCCVPEEQRCETCGKCANCSDGMFCYNCHNCPDCTDTGAICEYCGMCYDDTCGGMCSEGTEHLCAEDHAGYTCSSCDRCLLTKGDDGEYDVEFCNQCYRCEDCIGDEKCSAWDGDSHDLCLECHDDWEYCPDCHYCWLGDMINETGNPIGCMDCGRCIDCVDWICETCAKCKDCVEQCERCERKCTDCHEKEGKSCPNCGLCYTGVGRCFDCGYCGDCIIRCDSCMAHLECREDTHCPDCGACGRNEVELCEGCGRCPDCTDYCEDCHECAHCEVDTHCSECYQHFDSDALCPECGACGDCVELCDGCGVCKNCFDEALHCSECDACNEDTPICEECGMCDECAKEADQHCDNSECSNCFESYAYCETCHKCIECIGDDDYCEDCYQCKSHHEGGKCDGASSHTHKFGDWVNSPSHHWKECRLCKEKQSYTVHAFNADKKCTICGYDAAAPITITSQPKNVRAKVSDIDADEDDPLCPNNNNVSFKVKAEITGKNLKGTLSYQWYIMSWDGSTANPVIDRDESEDGHGVVSGAKTSKLTTVVDWECGTTLKYFCRVTLTSPTGAVLATVDSDMAELKIAHVYNQCEPVNYAPDYTIYLKRDDGSTVRELVLKDDGGHKNYCCGEAEAEHSDPLQKMLLHNYSAPVTVKASKNESGPFEEYYQYTCRDCGVVSYVKKHEHNYELCIDYSDPESLAFLEANCTNDAHPLRCTVEGCTAVSHEKHSFIPKVYAPPVRNENNTVTPGSYSLECWQCEYVISGRTLYEANNKTHWDTLRMLVSADHAAVQVEKSYGDFGFGTFGLAIHGDTVDLIPHQKDGKKIVDWKTKYTDYTTKYSGGEHDGEYVTVDNIGLTIYENQVNGKKDGTWWFVMPDAKQFNHFYVNEGGWLHLTPVYAECGHTSGTKLVNKVDAVCMNSGYTGDEVCVDCGKIMGEVGDFVAAPSTGHTGEWVLIEGTAKEATCTQKGYTGDYKCSACGEIKAGEEVNYQHGETEVRNVVESTCVIPGYTGDTYCKDCNTKIKSGRMLPLNENKHEHKTTVDIVAPTCVKEGYTGNHQCKDCGKTLNLGRKIPALGHQWDEGTVTKEPTLSETGTKLFHCTYEKSSTILPTPRAITLPTRPSITRNKCNAIKTEVIPTLSSDPIASVALTTNAPAFGRNVTAAVTTATSYSVANTSWLDESGNNVAIGSTFEVGKTYTVKVELEATGSNVFTVGTVFTVNGKTATLVALGLDSATLNYTFPAAEKPSTSGGGSGSSGSVSEPEGNPFVDVPEDAYYTEAVKWAVENGITGGMDATHFGPDEVCTRAQIVTFLWRAAGSPEPKAMSSFVDVPADAYYAKAVAWAVEKGITSGVGDGRFAPDATCTRAQCMMFLWRMMSSPAVGGSAAFSDVDADAYYAEAVAWAVENGITSGIGGGLFGSDNDCTRAQNMMFLYRSAK